MFEKIKNMKLVIIIAVIVLGFGGIILASKTNTATNPPTLSIQTIKNDIIAGGQLIDVRTPAEFTTSHIDGAINLSSVDIQAGVLPSAAQDKPLYLYCRTGNRSGQSLKILKAAGYTNIIDLGAMTHVQSLGGIIKS